MLQRLLTVESLLSLVLIHSSIGTKVKENISKSKLE